MRIALLVNDHRLVGQEYVNTLAGLGELRRLAPGASAAELAQLLETSDVAVTGWGTPRLPDPAAGWRLRYICHMTGEFKRIIPFSYWQAGIPVTNWGDAFSFATAEGAVALIFAVIKDITEIDRALRAEGLGGDRPRPICTLYRTRVGIYGLSTVGRLVADYLKPFRPTLSFYDPTIAAAPEGLIRYDSLRELFANNDIVTIHAGLNDATRGSVTYELLSLLPAGGAVINTARGPIVVEGDLARALDDGRIKAGLDVVDDEEDWRTSPVVRCSRTTLSGHRVARIGPLEGLTLQELAVSNLRRFINQEPLLHQVTVERYKVMT